jgi:hypothetical protein
MEITAVRVAICLVALVLFYLWLDQAVSRCQVWQLTLGQQQQQQEQQETEKAACLAEPVLA